MPDSSPAPTVSVVIATYNRANALRYALASVVDQTLADWEAVVVGDACTDDTAEVVASFADPRIRFVNMAENFGEQSGPNNEGVRLARGRFVAYLNHDDVWLPGHLERAVERLESTGADVVFALADRVLGSGARVLLGASPGRRYEPHMFVPASTWVVRREAIDELGPWRSARECHGVPSQDWLFRAWKAGRSAELVDRLGVVVIDSGTRTGVYARREDHEQREFYERSRAEAEFAEREVTEAALGAETDWPARYSASALVAAAGRALVRSALLRAGIHPFAFKNAIRYRKRGGFIDVLRARRGLDPAPSQSPPRTKR